MSMCTADLEGKLNDLVKGKKVLILSVGNPLRGDDGAAQLLARRLAGKVVRLRLLDCGTTPQDCVEEVVRLKPRVVIFVNAIDRSLKPGALVLDEADSTGYSGSSLIGHKFPLAWVASLVKMMGQERDLTIETIQVGIQVGSTEERITRQVQKSVEELREMFQRLDSTAKTFATKRATRKPTSHGRTTANGRLEPGNDQ